MRLPVDAGYRFLALGLTASLAGCGLIGGGDRVETLVAAPGATAMAANGPAADYPMVLGQPFTVEGELFTPADTLNYDSVGYVAIDDGAGITAAHRTLPLPSYVEVTSLESGKTVLVRLERRGPMAGRSLVALAPAASALLGAGQGAPVRVRRVNPTEAERAELRAGRGVPDRIETPKSLVEVLRRKLPASGAASLRDAMPVRPAIASAAPRALPRAPGSVAPRELPALAPAASIRTAGSPSTVTAYPLPSLAETSSAPRPVVVARAQPTPVTYTMPSARASTPAAKPQPAARPIPVEGDGYVVQAGAFSNQANAQRVARSLGGYVSPSGSLFRVRTGPFTSRGQAEAALAKVRAAGYSDARVFTAG